MLYKAKALYTDVHIPPRTYYGYLGNTAGSYHFIQIVVGRNILAYFIT
jgi:hypothetical protein